MSRRFTRRISIGTFIAQLPLLGIVSLGDFGFYFPGAMGTWNHFVLWMAFYLVVLIVGVVTALISRAWGLAAIHIGLPITLIFAMWCYVSIPEPPLNASEYQFLIGKPIDEVGTILRRRIRGAGLDGVLTEPDANGQPVEFGFQNYEGMTILYSKDRRVVEVRARRSY
ncbi:MAG TPA: hypothetical protein VNQ76_20940 [Planctomicrobium sp.]|nr:hypothetical protein [Planctomicrobium sp.]